jgi:PTS system nitrogen regulatory IIA component
MKISDFLAPGNALAGVRTADKRKLLLQLSEWAAEALDLPTETVAEALAKRESLGSTGLGGGVAIPHARLAELKAPYGIVAQLRKAIEFEAIDGQPVDIVFLLLLPAERAGEQLNALASVARRLREPQTLLRLRKAGSADELYLAMTAD